MIVFFFYIGLCCFFPVVYNLIGNSIFVNKAFTDYDKYRKLSLIVPLTYLVLVMGLRYVNVGADTIRYAKAYYDYRYTDWSDIFSNGYAYGFYIFNKLLSYVAPHNYTVYFMVIAILVGISLYFFLINNSEDYCMSQIMLLALGFIFFFMTGIKQTISMCILMFAYLALKKNNIILFIALTVLAATFHPTAFIFLLALPAKIMLFRKALIAIAPIAILLANIYQARIFKFFVSLLPDDLYSAYGTTYISTINITGLLIQITIFTVCLLFLWKEIKGNEQTSHMMTLLVIGMVFQAMTNVMGEFFRISMYFSIFGVILLPNAIRKSSRRYAFVLSIVICFVFIVYFFFFSSRTSEVLPYRFYWHSIYSSMK